jgi:hypothetical protein
LVELPEDKRQPNLFLAAVRHLDGVPRDGAHLAEIVQRGRERNRLMTGSDIGGPGPSADTSVMAGSGSIYSPTKEQRGWIPISLKLAPAVWPTIALPQAIYRQRQVMPAAIRRPGRPGRQACR